jgi:SAM-dependent methyltransferase
VETTARAGGRDSPVACEWPGYIDTDFDFAAFSTGSRVLDLGFGTGQQMKKLQARGCHTVGVDPDARLVSSGRAEGLQVCRAVAEALPFPTAGFDGVVCKVVVPYTDEVRAIGEIARVLRPGGVARVSYHGLGYFLRYLVADPNWKRKFYSVRTIANTGWYAATGRRLPGFVGDTLYQSQRRLRAYYAAAGLELMEARRAARFLGAPVFIYHVLRRHPSRP